MKTSEQIARTEVCPGYPEDYPLADMSPYERSLVNHLAAFIRQARLDVKDECWRLAISLDAHNLAMAIQNNIEIK